MAGTALGDHGCQALASALRHFVSLEKVSIGVGRTDLANKISDEAVTALVDSLPQGIAELYMDGLTNSYLQDFH